MEPTKTTADAPTICPEVAEATAVVDGPHWTVPGYGCPLSARPISPIALRAELATLQAQADDLRDRWLATVEVCGEVEPGMFELVIALSDSIERMRATAQARGIEYRAAVASLAIDRPDVWAAIATLDRVVNDKGRPREPMQAAVIAIAYALESMELPGHGRTDGAHLFFRALAECKIGGEQ